MFVSGFMATCWYSKPLLAVPKAQKVSLTVGTNENQTLESIMNSYFKPIANATMNCSTGLLTGYAGVTRHQNLRFKLDFVEKEYQKLTWSPQSPQLSGLVREPVNWVTEAEFSRFCLKNFLALCSGQSHLEGPSKHLFIIGSWKQWTLKASTPLSWLS